MLGGLLLVIATSPGCSVDLPLHQYPAFWREGEIRSVAVVPFLSMTVEETGAGDIVAGGLAAGLLANGTYERVMGGLSLGALLTIDEMHRLAEGDAALARRLKEQADIDAVIIGTVLHFDVSSETYYNDDRYYDYQPYYYRPYYPDHGYYRHGYYPYYGGYYGGYRGGYYSYRRTANEASIATVAQLLMTDTGQIVHATPPVARHVISEGSPPRLSETECLARAITYVSAGLTGEFAIVSTVVRVKRADTLRITTGEYREFEGRWDETDRFTAADAQMVVVIALPSQADRNAFRLTIHRKDRDEVLAEQTFIWQGDSPPEGVPFAFDPSQIAAAGGGPGKYVVTFHAAGEPRIDKDFRIVPAQ